MVEKARDFARVLMEKDGSGHDYFHAERVCRTALAIAAEETGADMEAVALIALLHDVDDRKLSPDTCETLANARAFLTDHGVAGERMEFILSGIRQISFKGTESKDPDTLEAKCVQDADRLDAIGAIGIARAFAYGGSRNRAMYDPAEKPNLNMDAMTYARSQSHTINHFYEKLLLLKDLMNTEAGKRMAQHRHAYMEVFLAEFYEEWNGER